MVSDPFSGPFARINSASAHLSHLKALQAEFMSSDAFKWATDCHEGVWTNKLVQRKDLPDKFEHVVWDVIQNLRASLDLAVCATALAEKADVDEAPNLKETYFYFAGNQDQWERHHKGRTRAAPSYARDIMRKFEPWADGNTTLYALSKVSSVTRHQLITPTVLGNSSTIMRSNAMFNGPGPMRIGVHQWNPQTRELIITETGFRIPVPIEGYEFTTFLAFGNVAPVAGEPIIPMLNALLDMCEEIVHTLQAAAEINRNTT